MAFYWFLRVDYYLQLIYLFYFLSGVLDAQFLKWLPVNLHGKLSIAILPSKISGNKYERKT